MERSIFAGFKNLNTGFDSPEIYHFSPKEFVKVIDRCEGLHVGINGLEVFTTDIEPRGTAALIEVEITPEGLSVEDRFEWARQLVRRYQNIRQVTISATFSVSDSVLKSSHLIPEMNCEISTLLATLEERNVTNHTRNLLSRVLKALSVHRRR